MGAFMMGVVIGITIAVVVYLVGNMIRSIQDERRTSNVRKIWKHFGLSLGFCILFFLSWIAQGIAQWQTFTDEQRTHGETVEVGDFASDFAQSTLENWQSEFLQLFSFVVMSALLIHRGSAESKDSDDRMQEALRRIEDKLGTR
jgi:predicted PurR-regulated permease PerM